MTIMIFSKLDFCCARRDPPVPHLVACCGCLLAILQTAPNFITRSTPFFSGQHDLYFQRMTTSLRTDYG